MKLQLDTTDKTITIEEKISFDELLSTLKRIFPNGEWKEYTLVPEVINNWSAPIYIPAQPHVPYNPYNPRTPWFTYNNKSRNSMDYQITSGIFDIETK